SASRLRSRQVICTIGSMPFCSKRCAATRLARCALAPAPSVTLTAVATPFRGSARFKRSAGTAETGGATSAVTTNEPLPRAADKLLPDCRSPLPLLIRQAHLSTVRHARALRRTQERASIPSLRVPACAGTTRTFVAARRGKAAALLNTGSDRP